MERDAGVLGEEVEAMRTQAIDLATRVAGATSEALLAEWAHSDGKLVRDGETLVVPLPPPGATPVVDLGIEGAPSSPSNRQVWWELLFGK